MRLRQCFPSHLNLNTCGHVILICFVLLGVCHYMDFKLVRTERKLNTKFRNVSLSRETDAEEIGTEVQTPSDGYCPVWEAATTDIDTVELFPSLEFKPRTMKNKHFWDSKFEQRFIKKEFKQSPYPLKVILMPHSHNDPGWRMTYEEYFRKSSKPILDFMMKKMNLYTNMTFVWSEVSFLQLWYDGATEVQREQLKALVQSGRLEIATGGWVMTDEANVHLYAMLNQLIEGHQWLSSTLGVKPTNGWSIDPFGHGPTVPYLLKESGISSTVIQRIHYAWKKWMAETQSGDFMWRQNWDPTGETDVLTHNCPYQMYSIRHSCGPKPDICINFDFRKIRGYTTDYTRIAQFITDKNVETKANLLLEQYKRTASIVPHNVLLVPIGDDFRYDYSVEWDQQYQNYQRLVNWINANPSYQVDIQFGTLKDYFNEVRKRSPPLPSLRGDFFVYGDIFTDGNPGYWSGYFTTRPYWKMMSRQLEATLNTAEFLYTWAWGIFGKGILEITDVLEEDYVNLVEARRQLSLFQHHDAITGTSKWKVMYDYGKKLHRGLNKALTVITHSSLALISTEAALSTMETTQSFERLKPNFNRVSFDTLPKMIPITMNKDKQLIVLTNSLAQRRHEMVKLVVTSLNLQLTDQYGHNISFQINPIWNTNSDGILFISSHYELCFMADLPPLSLITFTLHKSPNVVPKSQLSIVYSNFFGASNDKNETQTFETKDVLASDIQLESNSMKLLLNGNTGLLRSVTNKITGRKTKLGMEYASYPSHKFKSGAYLFKPDPKKHEQRLLSSERPKIIIHTGVLFSEITAIFDLGVRQTFAIFHVDHEPFSSAIFMENDIDLSNYNHEAELFFRFKTDINNGPESRFYTDQNGLGMQERRLIKEIGIQGNYYPITTATFLEDEVNEVTRRRVTLLVDHAAGVASWKQGYLEAMVERRTFYDDSRGMEEPVNDQKQTLSRYWILIEDLEGSEEIPLLSGAANHLSNSLNSPPVILLLDGPESDSLKPAAHFLNHPFPCSLHLLTMRTLADPELRGEIPLNKALMVIQHQSPSCIVSSSVATCKGIGNSFLPETNFAFAVTDIQETELTGLTNKSRLASLSELVVPHHQLRSIVITLA